MQIGITEFLRSGLYCAPKTHRSRIPSGNAAFLVELTNILYTMEVTIMFQTSLELNKVLFQFTRKYVIPGTTLDAPENLQLALTANKNLQSIGFTLSPDAINRLASLERNELISQYNQLYAICKETVGANVVPDATIFYPNFPDQVIEMDEMEHYINQIVHYIGSYVFDETILPETEKAERVALLEGFERKPKIIELGTDNDTLTLMRNFMFANNTLSKSKSDALSLFMKESKEWVKWIATTPIPNKENRISIANVIMKELDIPESVKKEQLQDILRDSVDVLRFAANLSNGKEHTVKYKQKQYVWKKGSPQDKHLEWRTKRRKESIANNDIDGKVYFKLNHSEERLVKSLLNSCRDLFTAVWLRPDLFKSLANNIHVNDMRYPRITKAFDNLFHGERVNELGSPIKSPYAIVNSAIEAVKSKKQDAFAQLESAAISFPGIFSRNLFHTIDVCHNKKEIQTVCDIYGKCCENVPVRELLKIYNLVDVQTQDRVVFMAKQNKYVSVPLSESREFNSETKTMIKDAIFSAIAKQLTGHEAKTIFIDPKTEYLLLPENGERNANKGSVLTTGSSYESNPDCNVVRQFIWWTNSEKERVDIDTAVTFYDVDMKRMTECAYYESKAIVNNKLMAIHSGDIVDGGTVDGHGAMEAIDIDKTIAREMGAKYAVLSVSSYTSQPYSQLPNVKFGFMEREGELNINDANKYRHSVYGPKTFNGEIFEPSTVEFCIDLNSNTKQTIPVVYDIEADKFIWIDKSVNINRGLINPDNNESMETVGLMIKRFCQNTNPTPSVGDLFAAYAATGGQLVTNPTEADIIIAMNKDDYADMELKENVDIISAFDMDRISAEFMGGNKELPEVEVVTESVESDHDVDDIEH